MSEELPVSAGADDTGCEQTVARRRRGSPGLRLAQVLAFAAALVLAGASGAAREAPTDPGAATDSASAEAASMEVAPAAEAPMVDLIGASAAVPETPTGAGDPPDPASTVAAPAAPAPSVKQIVERNAAARGGLAAWRAVHSLSEFGHMETAKIPALAKRPKGGARRPDGLAAREAPMPFTMHMKRPHKLHLEVQYQGATAIKVFDGSQGWTVLPSSKGPIAVPFSPDEAKAAAIQQDLDGPLIDSAAKGVQVALEGAEQVEGRQTYRLKLTLSDGQVRHLWVDAETFLDAKIDGTRIIGGEAWPVETYFSAYKKVHGLAIPHALDTSVAGVRSMERIVIDRVVLNPALDDAEFAPPLPGRSP